MIGYVMVGTNDLPRATQFYDSVLATLDLVRVESNERYVGYAPKGAPSEIGFYVTKPYDTKPATIGNGSMFALLAGSRGAVDQFYQTALKLGGKDEGAPGPRPADSPSYYAYARDLDGNKICAFSAT